MPYRLKLRVQARTDFLDATAWYAAEAPELGERFISAIDEVLVRVEENPLKYALIHGDIRRALARRFPYGVYFRVESDLVVVFAILHQARDPKQWVDRR